MGIGVWSWALKYIFFFKLVKWPIRNTGLKLLGYSEGILLHISIKHSQFARVCLAVGLTEIPFSIWEPKTLHTTFYTCEIQSIQTLHYSKVTSSLSTRKFLLHFMHMELNITVTKMQSLCAPESMALQWFKPTNKQALRDLLATTSKIWTSSL